ncbi:Soluble guanylate cyclase 89Db [Portunus trituberculatus]|uniref:guanylate cyclase n=1 Tax=Portunus trituberculatus TaxID=210409 RepID=A0A5B7HXE7_PORTR|nr:Soluble guanylate cyclase 89Db [Portunus trituberculatus]
MRETGLYLNDLSMHDQSREMVMKGWEHCSRLQITYTKAEENAARLEDAHQKHEEAKARGDDLLYSMLPREVADKLRQGNHASDTCQVRGGGGGGGGKCFREIFLLILTSVLLLLLLLIISSSR